MRPSPEAIAAAVEAVKDLPPPCPLALEQARPIIGPAWRRFLAARAAEAKQLTTSEQQQEAA